MAIRWSSADVARLMDETDVELTMADQHIAAARQFLDQAVRLRHLPQYMTDRMLRVTRDLDHLKHARQAVQDVRDALLRKKTAGTSSNVNPAQPPLPA